MAELDGMSGEQGLTLPEKVGPVQALALRDAFLALDRARPIRVDAGGLRHVGLLGLQVLLAAAREAAAAGGSVTLAPCAPRVDQALAALAIPPAALPRRLEG